MEEDLRQIVAARDPGSELTMRVADNPYADSYQVRGISAGTYLRLELHRLLPEVDKILYTDVDILFQGSLRELWETPLEGKFLAAVRAVRTSLTSGRATASGLTGIIWRRCGGIISMPE